MATNIEFLLRENACLPLQPLSKRGLIGIFQETETADFLNKIPTDDLEVVSFNPKNGNVCFNVNNRARTVYMASTAPILR